ncbi:MAG: ChrR family anti-sigma-E factor [Geminicoccaceae bacterium]
MTTHHPDEDLLLAYASGELPEPLALIVAAHITYCPECRREVCEFETIAGEFLETAPPEEVSETTRDKVFARLNASSPLCGSVVTCKAEAAPLPTVVSRYVADLGDEGRWRGMGGIRELELLPDRPDFRTKLMHIRAGTHIPRHTHDGQEVTILFSGGFADQTGHYRRGDVAIADGEIDHQPVADDDEDCWCLAVTTGRLRLTGLLGRWLNPIVRI